MIQATILASEGHAELMFDETRRMVDYCLDEFERYVAGEPLRSAVTPAMLTTMA